MIFMSKRNSSKLTLEHDKAAKALLKIIGDGEMAVDELVNIVVKQLNLKKHKAARAVYRLKEAGLITIIRILLKALYAFS